MVVVVVVVVVAIIVAVVEIALVVAVVKRGMAIKGGLLRVVGFMVQPPLGSSVS